MLNNPGLTTISLLLVGVCLTFIFVSLAFLASVITRDKAKGIGVALLLWFYFALLYDGLVMFLLFFFSDYPLEQASLVLITLNPIDLGRIIVLLNIDISALMGYTGALYKNFFDNAIGLFYAFGLLLVWIACRSGSRNAYLQGKICRNCKRNSRSPGLEWCGAFAFMQRAVMQHVRKQL